MSKGKTIKFYLMDGDPTQRIKCTLQNWIGVVYKIPRNMLEDCQSGDGDIVNHLKQTGIYFLLGKDAETDRNSIYIGQAGARKNGKGLLARLQEHKQNVRERYWDDWNEAIVLTAQNNSYGPTEISYLENKFTELARKANRYYIHNEIEPNRGNVTEETESEMSECIEIARMIIGVLGHNVFKPILRSTMHNSDVNNTMPSFKYKGKLNATGVMTSEGFVLLKGSQISPKISQSVRGFTVRAREQYADKIDTEFRITEDILFSSTSAAAGFVGGCSLSGNVMWVTSDGKTPKDF